MVSLPPELMTPEQREARAAQLAGEIRREWIRYLIADIGLITVPFLVLVVVSIATGSVSRTAVLVAGGVVSVLWAALAAYWLAVRIRPRREEHLRLQGGDG
jgi:hypothetical protein